MAFSNVALTTTFTPPADCLASITSYEGYFYFGYNTSCRPSEPVPQSFTFSPAWICPSGWSSATGTTVTAGRATETRVVCCPMLGTVTSSFAGDTSMYVYDYGYDNQCIADITGVVTASILSPYSSIDSTITTMTFNSSDYATIYAGNVGIAWQASDTETVSSSTTSSTTSSATPVSSAASATSTSASPTPTGGSSGLSTAAKIAIGVVIPVVVLAALAAGCLFVFRRRKHKKRNQTHEIQQEFIQGSSNGQMELTNHQSKFASPQVAYSQLSPGQHDDHHYNDAQRWSQTDGTYVDRSNGYSGHGSPNMRQVNH